MSPSVVTAAIVAAFALVGLAFLVHGGLRLRTVVHILRNDPVPVRQLSGRTGPVEIEGTAREDQGTVTAPFSGAACLAYEYEAEERRSSGKNSHWKTLDSGARAVPFLVEEAGDSVRVEPNGADLHLEEETVRVDPGDEPPGRIAEYLRETPDVDAQDDTLDLKVIELNLGNAQKFVERRLDVGEHVYVYGEAARTPAGEWGSRLVDAVIRDGERVPSFVISDAPERRTAWRIARGSLVSVALGAVCAAVVLLSVLSWL